MANNNQILNRLFTLNSFNELLQYGSNSIYSTAIDRFIDSPSSKSNGEIISEIYAYLSKNYRNEYYYENTLLNKLLLQVHKPSTTTALAQTPISTSIADFVLINGKAVVYEIKTELDTFDRLPSQIKDYYKAFTHVCVVTSETQFPKLFDILKDSSVGIRVINKTGNLSKTLYKEPEECRAYLCHDVIFSVLRKNEFENILMQYYKRLPDVTAAQYYTAAFEEFRLIPIDVVYSLSLLELKKRNRVTYLELIQAPKEIRSLYYFSKPTYTTYASLSKFVNEKYGG